VFAGGVVYIDSGRGGRGVAVDPTGKGNVTKTHLKWKKDVVPEGFSSPVAVGEYLYRLHSPETMRCWKLDSGDEAFTARLSGVSTASSPVTTADGRIYCASAGKSYVIQAGPKLSILAKNDLDDGCPASPAFAGGRIYLKGRQYLYCIGKK